MAHLPLAVGVCLLHSGLTNVRQIHALSRLSENHDWRIGVIVRDEVSRQKYKKQIGDTGIVL
jgi:hypothetical protein